MTRKTAEYDVTHFINKFEAIPEEEWCIGSFHTNDNKRSCALGHCGEGKPSGGYAATDESTSIENMFFDALGVRVAGVNDSDVPRYNQPTPKQRILAALYDIKAKSQPSYPDLTKQLAILPVEERADQPVKEIETITI